MAVKRPGPKLEYWIEVWDADREAWDFENIIDDKQEARVYAQQKADHFKCRVMLREVASWPIGYFDPAQDGDSHGKNPRP